MHVGVTFATEHTTAERDNCFLSLYSKELSRICTSVITTAVVVNNCKAIDMD